MLSSFNACFRTTSRAGTCRRIAVIGQQATFKAGTSIVPVLTTVTDNQGRLVPNLEQEEFTILDNGKPQAITFFQNETQPFTVVVMLDFSFSMTTHLDLLKRRPSSSSCGCCPPTRDRSARSATRFNSAATFTNDRDDLVAALKDLQFGNPTRLYDAIDASIDMLEDVEGRKIVLVFTDGDDTASRKGMGDVLDRAASTEMMVYAIGLESEFLIGPGGCSARGRIAACASWPTKPAAATSS